MSFLGNGFPCVKYLWCTEHNCSQGVPRGLLPVKGSGPEGSQRGSSLSRGMSPRPVSLRLRPQELRKEAKSYKALLGSLNEVSAALLELVPWRAREGLERTVAEDNDRFRLVSDAVAQRVEAIDAALLRAQQVGGHVPPGASPPSGLPTHHSRFQSHRRG